MRVYCRGINEDRSDKDTGVFTVAFIVLQGKKTHLCPCRIKKDK